MWLSTVRNFRECSLSRSWFYLLCPTIELTFSLTGFQNPSSPGTTHCGPATQDTSYIFILSKDIHIYHAILVHIIFLLFIWHPNLTDGLYFYLLNLPILPESHPSRIKQITAMICLQVKHSPLGCSLSCTSWWSLDLTLIIRAASSFLILSQGCLPCWYLSLLSRESSISSSWTHWTVPVLLPTKWSKEYTGLGFQIVLFCFIRYLQTINLLNSQVC